MKIIAKQKAFYKGEIIKVGQILDIKEKKIPSWAKELLNKNVKQEVVNTKTVGELEQMNQEELDMILDNLITQLIEKGLTIENTENKTAIEQIEEAKELLNKNVKQEG